MNRPSVNEKHVEMIGPSDKDFSYNNRLQKELAYNDPFGAGSLPLVGPLAMFFIHTFYRKAQYVLRSFYILFSQESSPQDEQLWFFSAS